MLVSRTLVVDAQQREDRGVKVVDVNRVGNDVVANASVSPYVNPGFIPPPAAHTVEQRGW